MLEMTLGATIAIVGVLIGMVITVAAQNDKED